MALAALSLGSNLGDRLATLERVRERLESLPGTKMLAFSSYYETEPVGGPEQENFLNAAALLETSLEPDALLQKLHEIENDAGRERLVHWGPRTLDLDLLVYGDVQMDRETLTLPHPRMTERRFVLVPLAEIAPDLVHPSSGLTARELLDKCRDRSDVTVFSK